MIRTLPICLFLALFFCNALTLNAQVINWDTAPSKGLVFQISNREAQRLLTLSKPDTIFNGLLHTLVDTFDIATGWEDRPSKGHFILANVVENNLHCEYTSVFPYQVFLMKEYDALSLQVLDHDGNVREDARVRLRSRRIRLDPESKTYRMDNALFNAESAFITVELEGFRSVFNIRKHEVPYWYQGNEDRDRPSFYSYMITDKNRYRPNEKVRFKSYALSHSRTPLRRDLGLWIVTSNGSTRVSQVEPHRPGSFAGEFLLHDSLKLVLDKKYQLQLRDRNGRVVATSSFRYEDYELHDNRLEVEIRHAKQYHPASNELTISATNTNGLISKDARATVTVLSQTIRETFQPVISLPDTLMFAEMDLDTDGPTVVPIPSSLFQMSNTSYEVIVSVLNSQNQRMERRVSATHYYNQFEITPYFSNDSIIYELRKNDIVQMNVPARVSRDGETQAQAVTLPYREKINPAVAIVSIRTDTVSRQIVMRDMLPDLKLEGGIARDSFNIALVNPHMMDVSWYIYQGSMLLQKGFGKELEYKSLIANRFDTYYVELLYSFGGATHLKRSEYIFREDHLDVTLDIPDRVYPGQEVEATIHVLDELGNPVNGVDLTAVATSAKLGHYLPDLPYYGTTSYPRSKRAHYSKSDVNKRTAILPLPYKKWAKRLALDTMKFYQFLYPGKEIFRHAVNINDSAQFAAFVMKDGAAKEVYVVEVDRKPVYYSWVDRPWMYSSYATSRVNHEISLRLFDRVIVIDSVVFEKGKKTILSLDLDNLPVGVTTHVLYRPARKKRRLPRTYPSFTNTEVTRHTKYISSFERFDPNAYLQAGPEFTPLISSRYGSSKRPLIVGPIDPGRQTYYHTWRGEKITYEHTGGFHYDFKENVVYKMNPGKLIPEVLVDKSFRASTRLNDLVLTKKQFLADPDVREEKWYTRVIDLVDHSSRVTVLLPPDTQNAGIGAFLFQACGSEVVTSPCVNRNSSDPFFTVPRGCQNVIVVYNDGRYLKMDSIVLESFHKSVIDLRNAPLHPADNVSRAWLRHRGDNCYGTVSKPSRTFDVHITRNTFGDVRGNVYDEQNFPLPGCNIVEKGTMNGTVSDVDGYFSLDISQRSATLVFSFIGYMTEEVEVQVGSDVTVYLQPDIQQLSEVVVVGYGEQRLSNLTGSVAGLQIRGANSITIRDVGADEESEVQEESEVVDEPEAEAALYRELLALSNVRSNFSDVGFWEPKLYTDRKGQSTFKVVFPDDLTRWDATVYAMNRRVQTGTVRKSIRSFKPLMAELHVPRFLTRGDSALFLGKVLNYTKDKTIAGRTEWSGVATPAANDVNFGGFYTELFPVYAATTDSIKMRYVFTRDDGYLDGEERSVPVIEQGVVRAEGTLDIIKNDAMVHVTAAANETVTVEVLSNPIEIYAGEIRSLVNYRYACNEQLASKLQGLINYKMLMEYEGKPFKHDRDVNKIISRLLRNQNEEFLWSWWDVSPNTSYWMSAHILRALHSAKSAGYQVDLDVTNIARKVTYQFDFLGRYSLYDIDLLNALALWNAQINYSKYVQVFDTIVHEAQTRGAQRYTWYPYSLLKEKLLLTEVRQLARLPYATDSLLKHKMLGILGEVYFGDGKPSAAWYSDDLVVNAIAYRIVRADSALRELTVPMQLYFLGARRKGAWNTYHASSVLMSVLPDLLATGATKKAPASIELRGKLNQTISSFPFRVDLDPGEELSLSKTSGLPVYLMKYVNERVTTAKTGVKGFRIATSIDARDGVLEAGKPATLTVVVDVDKDASQEYVMIEVPIAGACSYADKQQHYNAVETHREYFQDRTVIFCERMKPGKYHFNIQLLPRFTGKYFINPAQVSLMYVPVVNANTDMKEIRVKNDE